MERIEHRNMQKLKAANLYLSELIPISGKLVERYNLCLEKLGIKPTKLTEFSIDGIGWSPEVAEEKKQLNYLSNGEANQHGIIISPLQKGKPVYTPFHTFDREMMKEVFKTHGSKINDITRDCAICVDFDQGIDVFIEPMDILRYDTVTIKFDLINNLDEKQKEQLQLIERFNLDNNFIDEQLHGELLESAKKYGDLRNRDLLLEPIKFSTDSFYTKAFGGVYLLRGEDFISDILVFEDDTWYKEAIKNTIYEGYMFHISQPELMDKLRSHDIIEAHLSVEVTTPRYQRIKKALFARFLENTEHPIKAILDDPMLFKSYLNKLDVAHLKKVNGLEMYLERLERSNEYKVEDLVDIDMYNALHKPHSSLTANHQDLIWQLLVNVSSLDVLYLYWYDKEQFYKTYQTWDESFKDWVIEVIRNNI